MKLQPMTDFVLRIDDYKRESHNTERAYCLINNYANFLKQSLKLSMFVPCDENDVPLEEPKDFKFFMQGVGGHIDVTYQEYKQYQQAKERVIFEALSFVRCRDVYFIEKKGVTLFCYPLNNFETIEDLVKYDLTLTDSAIKQLNL